MVTSSWSSTRSTTAAAASDRRLRPRPLTAAAAPDGGPAGGGRQVADGRAAGLTIVSGEAARPSPSIEPIMAREFHVRRLACALTSGVVLAAAAAAAPAGTTAMATGPAGQSPNAHQVASQYCQDFVGHLSHTLGVSPAHVRQALTTAARQTVDDAVARGDLTQQQASGMKSQLSDGSICS